MIKSIFGHGRNSDARQCVLEAAADIKSPKLIFFFSGEDHFSEYSDIIHELFPDTTCIGSTVYNAWTSFGVENDVLNIVAIEDGITCSAGVIEKANNFALTYADNVKKCCESIATSENTVCLEFTVPRKLAEEYAIMTLNSVLLRKEIPVIGGTAACVGEFGNESADGLVSLNGVVYQDGCVFVLIHNENGAILLSRENIYEPLTGKEFTVTKANSISRTIMRLDDQPAADIYARELGISRQEIDSRFVHFPFGRELGGELYLNTPYAEGSNGSLKFHARVHEGTNMMVMTEGDYKAITRRTIKQVKSEIPNPSLVFMIHCVARTILFETNGYINEYQKLLTDAFPGFIGVSCLGEQMGTKNFNQTMLLVVFE